MRKNIVFPIEILILGCIFHFETSPYALFSNLAWKSNGCIHFSTGRQNHLLPAMKTAKVGSPLSSMLCAKIGYGKWVVPYQLWMFSHRFEHPMSNPRHYFSFPIILSVTHMVVIAQSWSKGKMICCLLVFIILYCIYIRKNMKKRCLPIIQARDARCGQFADLDCRRSLAHANIIQR